MAVQYGLSEEKFWHGDIRLLDVYQKAYMRDKSYTGWINGNYNFVALTTALYNGFGAKNKSDAQNYPNWEEPKFDIPENKIKDNKDLEEKFRNLHLQTNNFIRQLVGERP